VDYDSIGHDYLTPRMWASKCLNSKCKIKVGNRMNLLFDEYWTSNHFSNKPEIDQNHRSICDDHHEKMSAGLEDYVIMEYEKNDYYTIVTKDIEFIREFRK